MNKAILLSSFDAEFLVQTNCFNILFLVTIIGLLRIRIGQNNTGLPTESGVYQSWIGRNCGNGDHYDDDDFYDDDFGDDKDEDYGYDDDVNYIDDNDDHKDDNDEY